MNDVSMRDYGDAIVIHCTNEFLQLNAIQFMNVCNAFMPQKTIKTIIFDFSEISVFKLSSSGNLLQAVSRFTGLNIKTYLHHATEAVLYALKKTELLEFFTILESEDDFLLALPD